MHVEIILDVDWIGTRSNGSRIVTFQVVESEQTPNVTIHTIMYVTTYYCVF